MQANPMRAFVPSSRSPLLSYLLLYFLFASGTSSMYDTSENTWLKQHNHPPGSRETGGAAVAGGDLPTLQQQDFSPGLPCLEHPAAHTDKEAQRGRSGEPLAISLSPAHQQMQKQNMGSPSAQQHTGPRSESQDGDLHSKSVSLAQCLYSRTQALQARS